LAKEILELSDKIEDDNSIKVQRARLQVDSRKWLAAKASVRRHMGWLLPFLLPN
jgi:hypothetical protein